MIVTIEERKVRKLERLTTSVAHIRVELTEYARPAGGRYILFGSFARGEQRYDSDLDIVVDFPLEREREAWFHAEAACFRNGVKPDIHLASEAGTNLMARALADGIFLP